MAESFPNAPGPEVEAYERRCLDEVRALFAEWRRSASGHVRELRLEGSWPDTAVVIDYLDRRGEARVRRIAVWNENWADDDGSPTAPDEFAALAWTCWDEEA